MVCVGAKTERKETRKTGPLRHRPGTRALREVTRLAALLAMLLGFANSAHADPLIPFDGPEFSGVSFGFLDPANYGINEYRTMDTYYQAASSSASEAATSLLHIDPVSFERCARSSDNCDSDFHVFDVVWDVTLNADILADPDAAYDMDLILVDSDPAGGVFDSNQVTIDYASAAIGGTVVGFETANYLNGAYYFVDLALGLMTNGQTKRVGFTYEITGELPISESEVGFLFPVILPAASIYPIPEPGTATLLGLGLVALARRRKRT